MFIDKRFQREMFNDISVFMEASLIKARLLLLTHDKLFFEVLGGTPHFSSFIIHPVMTKLFQVSPAKVVFAEEIIPGML